MQASCARRADWTTGTQDTILPHIGTAKIAGIYFTGLI
jgi:hypothetical protein